MSSDEGWKQKRNAFWAEAATLFSFPGVNVSAPAGSASDTPAPPELQGEGKPFSRVLSKSHQVYYIFYQQMLFKSKSKPGPSWWNIKHLRKNSRSTASNLYFSCPLPRKGNTGTKYEHSVSWKQKQLKHRVACVPHLGKAHTSSRHIQNTTKPFPQKTYVGFFKCPQWKSVLPFQGEFYS